MRNFFKHLRQWGMLPVLGAASVLSWASASAFDYSTVHYNWTGEDGVTQTADLSQEATTKPQMVALIKEVYSNQGVPGTKTVQTKEDGTTETVTYPGEAKYGIDEGEWWEVLLGRGKDYTPQEHGVTALLVKLDDNFNAKDESTDFDQQWTHIRGIQVIDHQVRVASATNPGTLLNIDARLNKFFVMIKGLPGTHDDHAPFYHMFEELSPSDVEFDPSKQNAYEKMASGQKFEVTHNCGGITVLGHPTMMLGNDYDPENPSRRGNILIYVPDKRLVNSDDFGDVHDNYYNTSYLPYFFMYTIDQAVPEVNPAASSDGRDVDVALQWTSSLKSITQGTTPEEFIVERSVNGSVWAAVPASLINVSGASQEGTTVDAQGVIMRSQDATVSVTVRETVADETQHIEYRIKGRPALSDFHWVFSNVRSVDLQGNDVYTEPSLTLGLDHISAFIPSEQANQYANTVHMRQATSVPMIRGHVTAQTILTLVRFQESPSTSGALDVRDRANGTAVSVLSVVPTGQEEDGWYTYTVTTTSGEAPAQATLYSAVADGADGVLLASRDGTAPEDLLTWTDRFTYDIRSAGRADDAIYRYRLFADGLNVQEEYRDKMRSNVPYARMYSLGAGAGYLDYAQEEIMADTDHALPVSVSRVAVDLQNNRRVQYAFLNDNDGNLLARVNRDVNTGRYTMLAHTATLTDDLEPVTQPAETSGRVYFQATGALQGRRAVLTTYVLADPDQPQGALNTYGSPVFSIPRNPVLTVAKQDVAAPMSWADDIMILKTRWQWKTAGTDMATAASRLGFRGWCDQEAAPLTPFYDGVSASVPGQAPQRRQASAVADGESVDYDSHASIVLSTHRVATADPQGGRVEVPVWYTVRHYATNPLADPADSRYVVSEGREGWRIKADGTVTGVEDVLAPDSASSAPVEWFTLDGRRVAAPAAAGTYVRRQGSQAQKVMVPGD